MYVCVCVLNGQCVWATFGSHKIAPLLEIALSRLKNTTRLGPAWLVS